MMGLTHESAHRLVLLAGALIMGCGAPAAGAPQAAHPCPAAATSNEAMPSGQAGASSPDQRRPPAADADAGHHRGARAHGGREHGGAHRPLVHRFEDADAWAARFEAPERKAWQRPNEVVAAMKLHPGMTVVDLGTGTGYFLPYLSPALGEAGKLLAVDIEPSMVRHVRDRAARDGLGNVVPRLALPDDPLLEPASVDRILIVNTWHHIADRARYARMLARALRAGGEVWVVDYRLDADRGPPKAHRLPPANVAAELGQAGLQTRIDDRLLPKQYIVVAARPAAKPSPATGGSDSPFAYYEACSQVSEIP